MSVLILHKAWGAMRMPLGYLGMPLETLRIIMCICFSSLAVWSGGCVCLFFEKRHPHYLPCILKHPQEPKVILILKLTLIHGMPWDSLGCHTMPCVKVWQCLSSSQVALSALILNKAWGTMRIPLGYHGMPLKMRRGDCVCISTAW